MIINAQSLVRRRNEFGKLHRKEYENGNPDGLTMKEIRSWTTKQDGIASTISTLDIDRRIVIWEE